METEDTKGSHRLRLRDETQSDQAVTGTSPSTISAARGRGAGVTFSGTTVEVLAIVAKSEAESWLAQFADPQ